MSGIEYRRSKVLLDEIPSAYKDIDQVMEHARTLVEIKYSSSSSSTSKATDAQRFWQE